MSEKKLKKKYPEEEQKGRIQREQSFPLARKRPATRRRDGMAESRGTGCAEPGQAAGGTAG